MGGRSKKIRVVCTKKGKSEQEKKSPAIREMQIKRIFTKCSKEQDRGEKTDILHRVAKNSVRVYNQLFLP